ncbi:MAG: AraC family transcriptional regulator [Archangium sp.]
MKTPTVSGASIAALAEHVDLRDEFRALGLDAKSLMDPERRIDLSISQRLWEVAATRSGDADFGLHFARQLDLDSLHVLGHLALSSRTLGEALQRIVKYSRLLLDGGRTELEPAGRGLVRLFPGCRGLPFSPSRHVAEFNTAAAVVLTRLVTGRPEWAPQSVSFHHEAPATGIAECKLLLRISPVYGQAEQFLTLTTKDLELPVRATGPSKLGAYLESFAASLVAKLPSDEESLRARVLRSLVTELPNGGLTLEAMAKRCAMTGRTLQRRLAQEDVTFAELVDEARRQSAERMLTDGQLPLAEISFLLGFQEPSAFHRAFKRWNKVTPLEWKQLPLPAKRGEGLIRRRRR